MYINVLLYSRLYIHIAIWMVNYLDFHAICDCAPPHHIDHIFQINIHHVEVRFSALAMPRRRCEESAGVNGDNLAVDILGLCDVMGKLDVVEIRKLGWISDMH